MAIDPEIYPAYAAECGNPSRTKKLGFGNRPAVILVDVCDAYVSSKSPLALPKSSISNATSAMSALLSSARSTKRNGDQEPIPVFFAQTVYTHSSLRDAGLVALKNPHAGLFAASHPEKYISLPDADNYPELQQAPLDMLVKKKFPSPFFGTNIATQLIALGVDTVIIGGFPTSTAVRSTAIDAMQSGFRSIVVADACADRGHETHWANLMDHNAKYGDVVGLDEACEALKKGWTT
jgi:maleamate amidohydrolase